MIENVIVRQANSDEPPLFEVEYFDLEQKDHEFYLRTTRYGSETEVRDLMKSGGVPDAEIDQHFERAKLQILSV